MEQGLVHSSTKDLGQRQRLGANKASAESTDSADSKPQPLTDVETTSDTTTQLPPSKRSAGAQSPTKLKKYDLASPKSADVDDSDDSEAEEALSDEDERDDVGCLIAPAGGGDSDSEEEEEEEDTTRTTLAQVRGRTVEPIEVSTPSHNPYGTDRPASISGSAMERLTGISNVSNSPNSITSQTPQSTASASSNTSSPAQPRREIIAPRLPTVYRPPDSPQQNSTPTSGNAPSPHEDPQFAPENQYHEVPQYMAPQQQQQQPHYPEMQPLAHPPTPPRYQNAPYDGGCTPPSPFTPPADVGAMMMGFNSGLMIHPVAHSGSNTPPTPVQGQQMPYQPVAPVPIAQPQQQQQQHYQQVTTPPEAYPVAAPMMDQYGQPMVEYPHGQVVYNNINMSQQQQYGDSRSSTPPSGFNPAINMASLLDSSHSHSCTPPLSMSGPPTPPGHITDIIFGQDQWDPQHQHAPQWPNPNAPPFNARKPNLGGPPPPPFCNNPQRNASVQNQTSGGPPNSIMGMMMDKYNQAQGHSGPPSRSGSNPPTPPANDFPVHPSAPLEYPAPRYNETLGGGTDYDESDEQGSGYRANNPNSTALNPLIGASASSAERLQLSIKPNHSFMHKASNYGSLNIHTQWQLRSAAGALAGRMRKLQAVLLPLKDPSDINHCVKAICVACGFVQPNGIDAYCRVEWSDSSQTLNVLVLPKPRVNDMEPVNEDQRLRIAGRAAPPPLHTAGLISNRLRDYSVCFLLCMGPESVTQAMRSLCVSHNFLDRQDVLVFRPRFITIEKPEGPGGRSAVQITVEQHHHTSPTVSDEAPLMECL